MSHPVSVIIATWGDQGWSQKALRALRSASLTDAAEVLTHHDPAGDTASVRNRLAVKAKQPWLCFLDADDELHPGYLGAMMAKAEPGALLIPAVEYRRNGRRGRATIPNFGGWPEINDSCVGTLVERRWFLAAGGFRHEFWPWSDWELWLRLVEQGSRRVHVPSAIYVCHTSAKSANNSLSQEEGLALHAKVKALHSSVWQ